jgi:uncharacterized membrane protein
MLVPLAAWNLDMAKRDISQNQREWLVTELNDWTSQGLVSPDQVSGILNIYQSESDLADQKHSLALQTLMGVAAFLVGLGVLLLIGYNWEAMPDASKLAVIFGTIILTHVAGFAFHFRYHDKLLSDVAFFLACLFYGAGIFLVAQIFNLNAHYPDGVWWWAIGVLPFALCLDTVLLHLLLIALLALWAGMEIIGFGNIGMWFFVRLGFIPNGAYSLPIMALPGLAWAYRKNSVLVATLYVALITWWIILQPVAWRAGPEIVYLIGAVGGLMLIIAESHAEKSLFAIAYRRFGVLLLGGVLLLLSFQDFNQEVLTERFNAIRSEATFITMLVVSSLVIGVVLWRNSTSNDKLPAIQQIQQIMHRQWITISLVLLMFLLMTWHLLAGNPILPTIAANLAMLILSFWLISLGLREDRGQPFAAGIGYFLLWAIVRYFDLFGGFGGMVGAALMFLMCGASLIAVASYWRNRRKSQHA